MQGHRRLHGCLMANTATQTEGQMPSVRAAIHLSWQLVRSASQRQIHRAQHADQSDPRLDLEALNQAQLMSLQGLLILAGSNSVDLRQ